MLALKDISGIEQVLGSSPIAQTPLWNMPIDKILPAQLIAFLCSHTGDGAVLAL